MMRRSSSRIFLEDKGVAGYLAAITLKAVAELRQLSAEHWMITRHIIKAPVTFITPVVRKPLCHDFGVTCLSGV